MKIASCDRLESDDADQATGRIEQAATALAMVEERRDLNHARAIVRMQALDLAAACVQSPAVRIADGKDRFAQTQQFRSRRWWRGSHRTIPLPTGCINRGQCRLS